MPVFAQQTGELRRCEIVPRVTGLSHSGKCRSHGAGQGRVLRGVCHREKRQEGHCTGWEESVRRREEGATARLRLRVGVRGEVRRGLGKKCGDRSEGSLSQQGTCASIWGAIGRLRTGHAGLHVRKLTGDTTNDRTQVGGCLWNEDFDRCSSYVVGQDTCRDEDPSCACGVHSAE